MKKAELAQIIAIHEAMGSAAYAHQLAKSTTKTQLLTKAKAAVAALMKEKQAVGFVDGIGVPCYFVSAKDQSLDFTFDFTDQDGAQLGREAQKHLGFDSAFKLLLGGE